MITYLKKSILCIFLLGAVSGSNNAMSSNERLYAGLGLSWAEDQFSPNVYTRKLNLAGLTQYGQEYRFGFEPVSFQTKNIIEHILKAHSLALKEIRQQHDYVTFENNVVFATNHCMFVDEKSFTKLDCATKKYVVLQAYYSVDRKQFYKKSLTKSMIGMAKKYIVNKIIQKCIEPLTPVKYCIDKVDAIRKYVSSTRVYTFLQKIPFVRNLRPLPSFAYTNPMSQDMAGIGNYMSGRTNKNVSPVLMGAMLAQQSCLKNMIDKHQPYSMIVSSKNQHKEVKQGSLIKNIVSIPFGWGEDIIMTDVNAGISQSIYNVCSSSKNPIVRRLTDAYDALYNTYQRVNYHASNMYNVIENNIDVSYDVYACKKVVCNMSHYEKVKVRKVLIDELNRRQEQLFKPKKLITSLEEQIILIQTAIEQEREMV